MKKMYKAGKTKAGENSLPTMWEEYTASSTTKQLSHVPTPKTNQGDDS